MRKLLFFLMPWLARYDRRDMHGDLIAGLVVAVMLVPQAMAYAMLAGLPPVHGLYAATLPLIAYAIFGSSRQLAVGPVAIVSLLVADALATAAGDGASGVDLAVMAAILALLVGAVQVALGLCRAGFLVNFVSHAVVSGFTSAGAIMIGISQLQHLFRIKLSGGHSAVALLLEVGRNLNQAHGLTVAIGLMATAVLLVARWRKWRFPATLPVIAVAILVVWWFRLEEQGVRTVGAVPSGLPKWQLPAFSWTQIHSLLPATMMIVFIGVMESVAVAKWIASREKYRLDANRELVGLGMANVVAGTFSGYPVTGGFSRTAVNYQAGARTPLAAVFTAAWILLALLLLTPLFTHLPNAVLAAIIMVAVIGLIDFKEARNLFKIKPADGWVYVVTFLVTISLGMDKGLLTGIVVSLAMFIWRSARPHMAVLGKVGDHEYRDLRRFPKAITDPTILIMRVEARLYFANAGFVEEGIRRRLAQQPAVQWVVMEMSGVNDMDGVGVTMLTELMQDSSAAGVQFVFAGMRARVRDVAERAGWKEMLGERMYNVNLNQAMNAIQRVK